MSDAISSPPPLRIALLTYATKPRGSVIHTLELAQALQAQGQQVCIYALDKDGKGFERSPQCDIELIPAQPAPADIDGLIHQRIQEFVDGLMKAGRSHDLYHAQDCISANALSLLRDRHPVPAIVRTVHHIEDYNSPYLQQCQDRSIRQPDLCLCVSQHWQTALQQTYHRQAPRVVNGVNLTRFAAQPSGAEAELKQRLGLTGAPIYLTVGGIEPRKNSIALLQAFIQLLQDVPEAQLVIAGGATLFDYQPYREQFLQLARDAGLTLGKSLVLPGVIAEADLPVLYRTADAFVFPSIKEGWGLVLLEAIASGLPVLTANQPPFTEFLQPDQALLVDPQDIGAIAQAMQVMVQPNQAAELVRRSQSALTDYSWQASAAQHLHHYRQLLHLSAGPACR